jgi:hypothetical protein
MSSNTRFTLLRFRSALHCGYSGICTGNTLLTNTFIFVIWTSFWRQTSNLFQGDPAKRKEQTSIDS